MTDASSVLCVDVWSIRSYWESVGMPPTKDFWDLWKHQCFHGCLIKADIGPSATIGCKTVSLSFICLSQSWTSGLIFIKFDIEKSLALSTPSNFGWDRSTIKKFHTFPTCIFAWESCWVGNPQQAKHSHGNPHDDVLVRPDTSLFIGANPIMFRRSPRHCYPYGF